jgi:hypothetical protein
MDPRNIVDQSSSDSIVTGRSGFDSWQRQNLFLFGIASKPVRWPTQPPIQSVTGALSLGEIKRPGREVYHSSSSSAYVELHLHIPISLHSVVCI